MKLKEQVAIITGGAQGIGKAIAETLAKEGAIVVVSDINLEQANKTANEIKEKYKVETLAIDGNVAKFEDCEKIVKMTL